MVESNRLRRRRAAYAGEPSVRGRGLARKKGGRRGFTLVELAIVVVIVGIMATLATYGVTKYIRNSKTAEAVQMIGSIKAGQEAFFDETFRYYDVSGSLADDSLYPDVADAGQVKVQWGGDDEAVRWATIGVAPAAPVLFRYGTIAGHGTPGDDDLEEPGLVYNLDVVADDSHWYLVKAVGDLDGDGEARSAFVGSSFTSEIHSHNAGE